MSGAAEAIYASSACALGVIGVALATAVHRHDIPSDYWLTTVWALVTSLLLFLVAGSEARRQ